MSRAEEIELARRVHRGDTDAFERIIHANLRPVVEVARKFEGRGLHLLDLIQEGNIGLMKAVRRWDWSKGYRLSTYAVWWIREAIYRAIANQVRTVRIPINQNRALTQLLRAQARLAQELDREATLEELAIGLRISDRRVRSLRAISQGCLSLETPYGESESLTLGDLIADEQAEDPGQATAQAGLRYRLTELLATLKLRERRVLELRFGLHGGEPLSRANTAQRLNLTSEYIRQIEIKALHKMRHPSRLQELLH